MKSVHIATMHRRDDTRILLKECNTLARAGLDVCILVADGGGNEQVDGVAIYDMGQVDGQIAGKAVPMFRAMREAYALKPDVVHFHDGMFLPFAIALSLTGQTVVYDVHEDRPREVMDMRFSWLVKRAASLLYTILEWVGALFFRKIVAATPHIAKRFPRQKTVTVQNFPLHEELSAPDPAPYASRPLNFTYVGSITLNRGICEIVDAIAILGRGTELHLAGRFSPESLLAETKARPGWCQTKFHGWQSRHQISQIMASARAGLLVLHPRQSYLHSYPIKLFEYMATGLPVIASDFPLWRQIIEDAGCGLLVDPRDPHAVARAMSWILDNPAAAEDMGRKGREAVFAIYNWESEAQKLLASYREIAPK